MLRSDYFYESEKNFFHLCLKFGFKLHYSFQSRLLCEPDIDIEQGLHIQVISIDIKRNFNFLFLWSLSKNFNNKNVFEANDNLLEVRNLFSWNLFKSFIIKNIRKHLI